MRKTTALLLLIIGICSCICSTGPILAEQKADASKSSRASDSASAPLDIERYMTALSKSRRKLFSDAMSGLSAQQLETFWSVYGDYERDKNELAHSRVELVKTFAESFGKASGLSDDDVTHAVNEMASLQKKLVDLRLKYFDIYSKRLDPKTAGRFALADDYVSTAVRMEWLNSIPFPGDESK